jgi:hypothetical protein
MWCNRCHLQGHPGTIVRLAPALEGHYLGELEQKARQVRSHDFLDYDWSSACSSTPASVYC